ncbi:MAG: virulence RhuM family protein [Candidatus Brocadia sp.]|nr:virulence RhuM family protein [Candidatus Brocadia sp.]
MLFDKGIPTINEHIQNIYKEGELKQSSTIRKFRIVRSEGGRTVKRDIDFYNLDVIISVGYRVKSQRGTQFRIWATKTLTLLEQYDKENLSLIKKAKGKFVLRYDEVKEVIDKVRKDLFAKKEASNLFGQENSDRFEGILGNIYQTFGGKELYPSLEEKAAHLLYFIIKDHPFVDGNKRIGSFLFAYFFR